MNRSRIRLKGVLGLPSPEGLLHYTVLPELSEELSAAFFAWSCFSSCLGDDCLSWRFLLPQNLNLERSNDIRLGPESHQRGRKEV